MQQRISQCLIEDLSTDRQALVDDSMLADVQDVADMVTGYVECMSEAIRYLTEVEKYPLTHPAVQSLQFHLDQYRKQLLQTALYRTTLYHS